MDKWIISLSWANLESMAESIDVQLCSWSVPTILRLRVQVILEELFAALIEVRQGGQEWLRCSWPAPRTLCLQYRLAPGGQPPRLEGLSALAKERCTYGLKVELGENCCTVQIGQR